MICSVFRVWEGYKQTYVHIYSIGKESTIKDYSKNRDDYLKSDITAELRRSICNFSSFFIALFM